MFLSAAGKRLFTAATLLLTVHLSAGTSLGQTNLVAAYSFNEGSGTTVADASGSGNVGTITGATWIAAGKFGRALRFNGAGAVVTILDSASLDLTGAMTLEAWVNPSAVPSVWRPVIYKGFDNYFIDATTTKNARPAAGGIFGSNPTAVYGLNPLTVNTWTHLAGTYDGSTVRLYINGVEIASNTRRGNLATSTNPLQIGGDAALGQFFAGVIDEVRIYNVALTATQIQADMNTAVGSPSGAPDLTLTKAHADPFSQGQTGEAYTMIARNAGTASSSGTVIVTDTLPGGLTATAISGTGWSCTLATLTCTRSDALAAGASYPSITLTVDVAGTAPPSVINSATVSGGGQTNTANDTAIDPTGILAVGAPDLTITKTHAGNFTQDQTGASYILTVTNNGTVDTSAAITITDTLPGGLTATALSGTGWSCTLATLTCTRSDALAAGASYSSITLTVDVAGTAPSSVTNSATVSGGGETNTSNDTATDPTAISAAGAPDLTITKTHAGNFTQGQTGASYILTVTNNGTVDTSAAITVTDTLPGGLTATAISGTGWSCTLATLTCTRSDALAPGGSYASITLTVDVSTSAPAQVTNTATLSGGGETNTANDAANDATAIDPRPIPDLTLTKNHAGSFTQAQNGATYTLTTSNAGTGATSGTVTITDTLPGGLTATALSGTGWSCTLATLTCTRSDALAPGASYPSITLTVDVASTAPPSVTNSATVSGGGETNTVNDLATDVAAVTQLPDLALTKTHAGTFAQGQAGAAYTIAVRNSGTGATIGVVTVTDTLPSSLTATAISGTGWSCVLATLTCTRSDVLAAGASYATITVAVDVSNSAPAQVTNSATVSGGGEANAANDSASDLTTIDPQPIPDLTLIKTHAGAFTQGQTGAIYTLTARNSGTGVTNGTVTVTDALPGGLTATALSGTGWSCTLATLTCTRADALAAGATYAPITLTVNVASSAPPSVTNTASITGGGETNSANDSASDVTTIASQTSSAGLVAAYSFNEGAGTTVGDFSGSSNTGSVAGATWTTAGRYGGALSFNGTGARVTIPDAPSLRLTTAMTLEAWVRPSTVTSVWRDVVYKGNDNYFLEATSTTAGRPAAGGTFGKASGTAALPANTWTHLALTYDRATIRLYVNGAQVSSVPATAAIATSANPLQIGGDSLYGQYFTGLIDEVRVYNTALTAAQVEADMNAAISGAAPDLTLTKSHGGSFLQGQIGAAYAITARNAGMTPTSGTVSVVDALPSGLTARAMAGDGWTCTLSSLTCTRSDALAPGAAYPAITLTVDVVSNAPASITNTASISGGGETDTTNDTAADVTTIIPFDVSPHTAVITSMQTQGFSASGASGQVVWAVDDVVGGTPAAGTISPAGVYTPPPTAGSHTVTVSSPDQGQSARATVHVTNYAGTFTRDVDNMRTGLNSNETVLNLSNVNSTQFGKLLSYDIDGVSDASPLYVANVNIPGVGTRNVVYVATEHDSVYAFDADGLQASPLWKVSFIDPANGVTPVPPQDTGELRDIAPEIGITGSPVIDAATNTLYVVVKTKEVSGITKTYVHRLHALDITDGSEKFGGPKVIAASVQGTGDGSVGGVVKFISLRENQRAALMLSGGVIYIAFAGHGDQPPYHGWILGYRASDLQQVMAFNTTPNGEGGGVWQSGDGLATDSTGHVYFVTGDGDFTADVGGNNYGDSFMKVSPSGAVVDYFTPHDQAAMDASDIDLGSGGTTLLPDQPGPHPHLAISAGKNGTIYLVDRDNMGRFNPADDSQIVQTLVNIFPNGSFITGNFKAPVYWNGRLYFSADADNIKSFRVTDGLMSTSPDSLTSYVVNYPGATLSLSSNGAVDGILWAIERIDLDPLGGGSVRRPGVLHAFDANNLGVEIYSSDQAPAGRDGMDFAAKWASPLIANGKVFIASNGRLTAFGLLP